MQELGVPVIAINPDNGETDVASLKRDGVDVVLVPGVGHFLMMEDPDGFNPLLSEAVGRLLR